MMSKYNQLRAQYPFFDYEDYHWHVEPDGLHLRFDFRMGPVEFHPTALIERRPFLDFSAGNLDLLVFNIGMIELISYWKCACPPTVRIHCGSLTDNQISFWRKLYWHGLGEFFYTNGISESAEAFMQVGCMKSEDRTENSKPKKTSDLIPHTSDLYLVPIGGGKDSVVTLELLRRAGKSIRPLIMNPRGATIECARVAGFPIDEVLVIRRTIDPKLLELNVQGYLNGHTPFSAMLAFYTHLAAVLSGIPNVALSNENSANESTVLGTSVNHQYSKSLEFEDDFRNYVAHYPLPTAHYQLPTANCQLPTANCPLPTANYPLPTANCQLPTANCQLPTYNYFSFLRPLSELQIAMLFSRFSAYHDVFRSCNVGSKQDIWCGHCAKCLFAYIILSPFIAPDRLNAIFGKSMLDDSSLELEFRQLLGLAETKPFECVGTVSEVRQALQMAVQRWYKDKKPKLLQSIQLSLPSPLSSLSILSPIGNLTPEERQILQVACTEKIN